MNLKGLIAILCVFLIPLAAYFIGRHVLYPAQWIYILVPGIITWRFVQEQKREMVNMGSWIAPFFWTYYTGLLFGNLIAYAEGR